MTPQSNWATASRPSGHTMAPSPVLRCLVRWQPAVMAFSDGFAGGLTGGASYRLLIGYFHPQGWQCSWLQVLALSLILGGFESWRVCQGLRFAGVRRHLVVILLAASLLWWSLAMLAGPKAKATEPKRPPRLQRATLAQADHLRLHEMARMPWPGDAGGLRCPKRAAACLLPSPHASLTPQDFRGAT